jgi:hypothetical protein
VILSGAVLFGLLLGEFLARLTSTTNALGYRLGISSAVTKILDQPRPEMVGYFHQYQSDRQVRQKGIRADAVDLLLFPVGS